MKTAIWIQTEGGLDWQYDMPESREAFSLNSSYGEMVELILEAVQIKALNYRNSRIEKYLDDSLEN